MGRAPQPSAERSTVRLRSTTHADHEALLIERDVPPGVDHISLDGEEEGFARIHVQKGTDKIVGATIVAAHAGDMISEFSVAMKAGASAKTIAATIHPYPTQTEVNKKVVNLWRKAHFTPRTKNLLMKLFAWMRRG